MPGETHFEKFEVFKFQLKHISSYGLVDKSSNIVGPLFFKVHTHTSVIVHLLFPGPIDQEGNTFQPVMFVRRQ